MFYYDDAHNQDNLKLNVVLQEQFTSIRIKETRFTSSGARSGTDITTE